MNSMDMEQFDNQFMPLRKKKSRMRYRVAVIGGGTWATAIIKILSTNLEHIHWWVREEEIVEGVAKYGHNPLFLSSVFINPREVKVTNDIRQAVAKADYIVIVTPSAFLHKTLEALQKSRINRKKIIIAVKGIVPETMQVITEYLRTHFDIPFHNMAVISGPSHAEEVSEEKLSFLTSASPNHELAETVARFFKNRYVRTTVSNDIKGVELAVVLKNIYALGAGIYSGLGYGDNFIACYVSNCLKEMKRFVNQMYANEDRQFTDSVYLGDLLVTAYSRYSRNRMFGSMIGHGLSVKVTLLEMKMVAEGYFAASCVYEINKKVQANIPIVEAIYNVLYENIPVAAEMKRLSEFFV
jgi:glycerol-3-phosphate dehydrogenase (NAD(P)+)